MNEGLSAAAATPPNRLPALLAVVVAIVLWVAGDELADRVKAQDERLAAASLVARRSSDATDLNRLKQDAETARTQRRALEDKLRSDDDLQLVRAKMVYELRQKCAAAGVSGCNVRLSEDANAATGQAGTGAGLAAPPRPNAGTVPGAGTAEGASLAKLGVQRVRATLSGSFRDREFVNLSNGLVGETKAQWRINGLVVRAASFELDVERHLWSVPETAPAPGGSR